ncbi:hypothetical protein M3204_23495 [Mesobacillus subterraneus]|uniref:hypothetical protein n=1 Tax=Mesobacillus subterraneus TaxID=285983 RepID=UPI00204267A7|nr:hypothetical protein [Mesobacillus subterraneus]MCM3667343.1 hypothetical protein [Mesobacillus subterraneus]MCM3686327.1 hypothetical protein [Mesobacillus subterraneus]
MKLKKLIFGIFLMTLLLTGCISEPQEIIKVDMRNKENDQFETHKTILDLDKVTEVKTYLIKFSGRKVICPLQ